MSRSGYSEGWDDTWSMICYRGRVTSAVRGKRGQQFFLDLLKALEDMPVKELIAGELEVVEGDTSSVCAIGALGRARGMDMSRLDPEDPGPIADAFGIAEVLAREVVYANDEQFDRATPADRWWQMRCWAIEQVTGKADYHVRAWQLATQRRERTESSIARAEYWLSRVKANPHSPSAKEWLKQAENTLKHERELDWWGEKR